MISAISGSVGVSGLLGLSDGLDDTEAMEVGGGVAEAVDSGHSSLGDHSK